MISYLTGTVQSRKKQTITLTAGHIGLELFVPDVSVFKQGAQATLHVCMNWNQEQGPSFYGFASELEKSVFQLVTSCSGIGPRIALAVLADLGAQGFLQAVQAGDERMLSKVNGIGLKKAEQMIVQLKHKAVPLIDEYVVAGDEHVAHWHTISDALQALNYSRTEIHHAIKYVKTKNDTVESSFDQLLRQALSFLSKQS